MLLKVRYAEKYPNLKKKNHFVRSLEEYKLLSYSSKVKIYFCKATKEVSV